MQSDQSFLAAHLAANSLNPVAVPLGNYSNVNNSNNNSLDVGRGIGHVASHTYPDALLGHASQPSGTNSNLSSPSYMVNAGSDRNNNLIGSFPSSIGLTTSNEELNVSHQQTAELLNQYHSRQDQVEQRERILLEQQLTASALNAAPMFHVTNPILLQLQQQQLAASCANARSEAVLLELLRQKDEQYRQQRNIVLSQLQGVSRSSFPTTSFSDSSSLIASASSSTNQLQQRIQRLRELDTQQKLSLLLRQYSSGGGIGFGGATSLFSHSRNDIQQSSTDVTTATGQMLRQNTLPLHSGNTAPISMNSLLSLPGENGRKPFANTTPCRVDKMIDNEVTHRMERVGKFPLKLHALLIELKEQGKTDVAAFLPNGLAFGIFNTAEFVRDIMPQHFRMSRYSSFQRQLNLYEFQRITEGPHKGTYQHPMFIEDQPNLLCGMKRNKIKGIAGIKQLTKSNISIATGSATAKIQTDGVDHNKEAETDEDSDVS